MPIVLAPEAPTSLYIQISRLAQHTRGLLADARVRLMIAETDSGAGDPRTLARVSIEGEALELAPQDRGYERPKTHYLARSPDAAFTFYLADFTFFRIAPTRARYVAGFGRIYNPTGEDLAKLPC